MSVVLEPDEAVSPAEVSALAGASDFSTFDAESLEEVVFLDADVSFDPVVVPVPDPVVGEAVSAEDAGVSTGVLGVDGAVVSFGAVAFVAMTA
ncbi:hypothetical protein [Tsukamurella strandjordii]|uniref:Uncharacterized protein n=1 Tax=Tsukamurella strandjordii TaxID=147577 RepID=A0AA90SRE9_9ACTN|nr:hypothetical protein [Tsukamurella strandjordii]MDP0398901.1 hypothetical protein [Tsukamurella strandjordii]